MADIQALPDLWLLSDERNDTALDDALRRLPEGSGFVFRHYHLDEAAREKRFRALSAIAHERRHIVVLSGSAELTRSWGADGIYGPAAALAGSPELLRIATAHNLAEIGEANRIHADAAMLSPVFATRSHPDAETLGPARFRLLAREAAMPVIALGGMTIENAAVLDWPRWAAIDGLS